MIVYYPILPVTSRYVLAPLDFKAKVTVVVRNSLLEQAHHDGPLGSRITIAQHAAGPLSQFLAAHRREPINY